MREIAGTLENAGFETWCVGGAVRDALLGHPHLDWDLATAARPEDIRRLFRRTVPVGVEFGTVGVLDRFNVMHEVTTFRRDVHTDGRHAVVEFGASLVEDLARRDYTINAIAFSPATGSLADPFEGRADLEKKIVRAVGDARQRMTEDRLRALRGIRFAARFGFRIDPPSWEAIAESAPFLGRLSAERVKQEIEKTMDQVRRPSGALKMWADSGALEALLPEIAGLSADDFAAPDFIPPPRAGVARDSGRRTLRLAALLASVPAPTIATLLKRLRFSNSDASWVAALVDRWQSLGGEMTSALLHESAPDDATLRRWAAGAGRTMLPYVIRLASALWSRDRDAGRAAPAGARVRATFRRAIHVAYRDPIELADLAVDGDDLMRAGIAGRAVGETLRELLKSVINDPALNTHERLMGLIVARPQDRQEPRT